MPQVRSARIEEVPLLGALEISAGYLFREAGLSWVADGKPMDPELLKALCRNGTLWVAVDDKKNVVGFLAGYGLDSAFFIAEVAVSRPFQRQGVGTLLIDAVIQYARGAEFPFVTLTTYRDLAWNGPFYSKLGFAEVRATDAGPDHAKKLRSEVEAGHDPSRRCVMQKQT